MKRNCLQSYWQTEGWGPAHGTGWLMKFLGIFRRKYKRKRTTRGMYKVAFFMPWPLIRCTDIVFLYFRPRAITTSHIVDLYTWTAFWQLLLILKPVNKFHTHNSSCVNKVCVYVNMGSILFGMLGRCGGRVSSPVAGNEPCTVFRNNVATGSPYGTFVL